VRYTPDWEPLADVLRRVIIATGISEAEAKIDVCRAVADRKIEVRVRIGKDDYGMAGRVFSGGNVEVPPHLGPTDLDWVNSHPFARWAIVPTFGEHYFWIDGSKKRPIDLLELSTANVSEVLCRDDKDRSGMSLSTANHETDATKALASYLRNNSLTRAEAEAWCRANGHTVSKRGFKERVWPKARVQAGLPEKAPRGRRKTSR
jgi:hypothetical protein